MAGVSTLELVMAGTFVTLIGLMLLLVLVHYGFKLRHYMDRYYVEAIPGSERGFGYRANTGCFVVRLRHRGRTVDYVNVNLHEDDYEDQLMTALVLMEQRRMAVATTHRIVRNANVRT